MMDTIYCKKETFLYGLKKPLQQSYQSLYTNLIDRHLRHLFVCVF